MVNNLAGALLPLWVFIVLNNAMNAAGISENHAISLVPPGAWATITFLERTPPRSAHG